MLRTIGGAYLAGRPIHSPGVQPGGLLVVHSFLYVVTDDRWPGPSQGVAL